MKLLCLSAGIILLILVAAAFAQAPTSPAQTPPAQTPAARGQTPPAPGQTQAPPRRVQPPRTSSMHIFVRNQTGTPIEGVRVILSGAISREGTTNASGVVTLASLRDGSYRLRFEREGFITLEREVTVRGGQAPEIDVALNIAPPPPPPPRPEPAPALPPPPPPVVPGGPPVNLSIPAFLDKNFIGREPLKESVLGCTSGATTRLLQLRDPLAAHTHADLDEVLYIVAGEGSVRIGDESMTVSAGSLTVIPRGLRHSVERRGKNPLIVISMLAGMPCQATSTTQSSKK